MSIVRTRWLCLLPLLGVIACGGEGLNALKDAPPVVSAGPDRQVPRGQELAFNGSAKADVGRHIVSWAWDFGDGTQATTQNPAHTYEAVGTFTVKLTATDDLQVSGSATAKVTVANMPTPPPMLTAIIMGPTTAMTGQTATFDGSQSSPANVITGWHWDFGDGTQGSGEMATHAFATAGTFPVKLMVTDAQGHSALSDPWPVTVTADQSSMLPSPSQWTYGPVHSSDQGKCGFAQGPLTITVNGTSITVSENDGIGTTQYTGTYTAATRTFHVSNSMFGTQTFDCAFATDFKTFSGNYSVNSPLPPCMATIPVTGTRTSP